MISNWITLAIYAAGAFYYTMALKKHQSQSNEDYKLFFQSLKNN